MRSVAVTETLPLAGWTKVSCIDFPGTVSTVLFFSGCNLRCPYCHNPHVVHARQTGIAAAQIWEFLERRRGQLDGVVLSGGEPTCYSSLPAQAERIRQIGYRIKLDTNGLRPAMIQLCRPDYLALDIKTCPSRYPTLLGAGGNEQDIRQRLADSVAVVRMMGGNAEVRITIAPGVLDAENINEVAAMVQGVETVWLQPMQSRTELLNPEYASLPPVPRQEIELIQSRIAAHVGSCRIRGE